MKPERSKQIDELVEAALERSPEERVAFLDAHCIGDESLRREVERLLSADARVAHLIELEIGRIAADIVKQGSVLTQGTRVGRYRIFALIGKGGMATVYLAEDTTLRRRVALKVLRPDLVYDDDRLRRFDQEARAASALSHPNIVVIHEIGSDGDVHFIVTEFIDGETLRERMSRSRITIYEALDIAVQIAGALAEAHQAGIIHRDVKPENIMLRADGLVKVLDFGLAKLTEQPSVAADSDAQTLAQLYTEPGTILGTISYMSPEQARGQQVDARSDVFSLGVIIYEMLAGRTPFVGDTTSDLIASILKDDPAPLTLHSQDIPGEAESLVTRALRKNRGDRYQTVVEILGDLRQLKRRLDFEAEIDARGKHGAATSDPATVTVSPRPHIPQSPFHISSSSFPRITSTGSVVGRKQERAAISRDFASVVEGRGLLLCIGGEPGIGKTTLVEDLLSELAKGDQPFTVARGKCSERLAGTEAYLPVLEALNHLLTGDAKLTVEKQEPLRRAMKQLAPNWYVQAAPLSAADEQLLDERRVHSQERLKRELGAFFQEISRLHPIVLFIDDLQWADSSTIDLLAYLAGKFDAMRMLVVVNYRESDLLLARHPFLQLKRDLQARGLCHEIRLQFLSRDEIENYLALEFPDHRFPQNLPALIHSKTEGSPLFMADLARYLRYRNVITQEHGRWVLAQSLPEVERELPESVRGMIERKIAQLTEEDRLLLVAASVQGDEFDSAVVAKVLGSDAADFEERLDELESVHSFVRLIEEREFPDRTLTQRYRFVHVLYQNALYNSLRPTRKAQLSAAVARALEGYWGERSAGIANELAVLWEAAREYARAAEYFRLAAQNASQVFASREAVVLVRRGLALLESLPDTRERSRQELPLQVVLGNVLVATNGFVSQEVEMTYSRARVLCQQLDDTTHLLPVLYGLHAHHTTGGDLRGALEIGDEFLKLAQRQNDPAIIVAHGLLGVTLVIMAEFTRAREHLEQSVSQYDPARHRSLTWLYTQEPGMAGRAWLIWTLWALGYADQALARESEALQLSREVMHANSQAYALFHSALHHQFRREVQIVRELAETMIPLAEGQGMAWWLQIGMFMRGWVMSEQGLAAEGIDEMRRSLDAQKSLGAETSWPYELCLLGEANGKVGQLSEAFALLDEAQKFVDKYGARYWEAELHRTRGELLLKSDPGHRTSAGGSSQPKAEECFHRAISIARQQEAKSLELRAVMGLARLWRQQGKRAEAHKTLAEIYGWFTEGFDTADLIEAKNLLDQLT